MPSQAPPSVAVPFDWSRFYVGGHVGYGRGYGRNTLFDPNPSAADSSSGSLLKPPTFFSQGRFYVFFWGLGILIGDGQLNYRPEQILEAYYAYSLNKWATLTFDYQFIDNPGYNADRGPVSVFSGRLHAQF